MRKLLFALTLFAVVGLLQAPSARSQWKDILRGLQKTLDGQSLSQDEIAKGLKEALKVGTERAVESVSQVNGYFNNPRIRIPLPEPVRETEKLIRAAGFGAKVDAFELSMNRAAEKAAPEAKALFWDAIRNMSFSDAKEILDGRDNEATLYFQEKTSPRLREIVKPIVRDAMGQVGVTRSFQELDKTVRTIPFAGSASFDLDQYVTNEALEGLFFMVAEEERKIRENPAARTTDLLQKVFGGK